MSKSAQQLLADALDLPPTERTVIVEGLLSSLDRPDAEIDALWVREAMDRIAAFDRGEMKAYSADEVFDEFKDLW